MRRSLKPGILATIGAVMSGGAVACSGLASRTPPEIETRNPPLQLESVEASFPKGPFYSGQPLEARDAEGRTIGHGSGGCWVELPFATPPTSVVPPPTQAVACPPQVQDDPAYAQCDGGGIHLKSQQPLGCTCYFFGNPPPPSRDTPCPTVAIPELLTAPPPPPSRNPPALPPGG